MDSDEAARKGYARTPLGLQWSGRAPREMTTKSDWQACHACGARVPVVWDIVLAPEELVPGLMTAEAATPEAGVGTHTYVCPFCGHCHVGTPSNAPDLTSQNRCHNCKSDLGGAYQCPKCSFPRGWMTAQCPYCGNRQPVFAPHMSVMCDAFTLQCVRCEAVFRSLCIC